MKTASCKQSGFTLLEILVGIALGIVVLGGILSVYIPALQTWRASAATATLQDVQQRSYDILSRSIRQSGLLVCGDNSSIENSISAPVDASISKWAFNFNRPFKAVAANDNSEIISAIEATANINSVRLRDDGTLSNDTSSADAVGDLFYTLLPGGESMRIVSNNNKGASGQNIVVNGASDIKVGELFLIHDCSFPLLVRAEAGSAGNTIIYTNNGKHTAIDYPVNTMVTRYTPTLFYLGVLNGTPTLYQRKISKTLSGGTTLSHTQAAVLSGIENIRLEYGIDLPAAVNSTPGPSTVTNYYTLQQIEVLKATIPSVYKYALVVRVSLMIRTDQNNSNSFQKQLLFPGLDGTIYDCYSATTDSTACPGFLSDMRDRVHKVVSFTVNLSTKYYISQ